MISIRKPIMSVNPLNVELPDNMEEPEKCGICQEALSSAQSYTLPECKHKFHTHCIITWFRTRPPSDDILAKFFTPGSGRDETMSDAPGLPD